MNTKKIIVPLIVLLAIAVYFVAFHKNKSLKYIPENADAVILIDVKKLTGQYLFSLAAHPSGWSGSKNKRKSTKGSLKDAGIIIPDFLQIFHIKDTKFSEWYSVAELKDSQKFISFLKKQSFTAKGNNRFQKDQIFIVVTGNLCIAGTSDSGFEMIKNKFPVSSDPVWNADQFINNAVGSISFISGKKIQNFSIDINEDEIEIKNSPDTETFNAIASQLEKRTHFLDIELDKENVRNFSHLFNKSIADSSQVTSFKATADLEQLNDTIISYEYDDNFNEVEKKTVQKITQPIYTIDILSNAPEKTWEYFQAKKWINNENQFTAIPFQPNVISRNKQGAAIRSTQKAVSLSPRLKENYILIRNSALLYSSLKTLSTKEKRIISDIDYVLYTNKSKDYWIKIKAKNGELPLILRW
ncbi:hypothetical protein [Chryseobacterium culicis]|uniref:Intein N-terminal splicing region n=1 Tax=Chryseobacterium culicis TaxID=680127 RepID=A0A1H6HM39_CHRCI|nr:hypothetical protein [Chryseobacterium culicis]SEH35295.1 intein N-terminal splicing region [Chryseobacterium culicis]